MVVDRLEQVQLASLDMVQLASLNSVVDRLDERTDLNNVVETIMLNQQPCSCMIEHVVRE